MSSRPPQRSPDALTFLMRAMVYEVWVVALTGIVATVILFATVGHGLSDLYMRMRGPAPISNEVAQVTLGPEALYLWDPSHRDPEVTPRALLAEVVTFLDAAGASVVVLDILLDQPADDDDTLAAAARAHGRVIGAERSVMAEPASELRFQAGITASLSGAIDGGFANLYQRNTVLSPDLLVRGVNLVQATERATVTGTWPQNLLDASLQGNATRPSLGLAAAWLHRHPEKTDLSFLERRLAADCPVGGTCTIDLPDLRLAATPDGLNAVHLINFRAPENRDPIPTIRVADILRLGGQAALTRALGVDVPVEIPEDYASVLRGRVVVVGRVGPDADRFITPFSFPGYFRADMSGCRIQAQLIDGLLSGTHLRRVGTWASFGVGLLGILAVIRTWDRTSPRAHLTGWSAVMVGTVLLGGVVFWATDGLLLRVGPAISGTLLGVLGVHVRAWADEARHQEPE